MYVYIDIVFALHYKSGGNEGALTDLSPLQSFSPKTCRYANAIRSCLNCKLFLVSQRSTRDGIVVCPKPNFLSEMCINRTDRNRILVISICRNSQTLLQLRQHEGNFVSCADCMRGRRSMLRWTSENYFEERRLLR